MSPFQRGLVWISSALTGITGVLYAWMKYMMEPADPWAVINHPLEPWVLKAHILVAPVMVFAVGLIAADHIWRHWRSGVKVGRRSGLTALWVFVPMVFSGYLIQAVTHAGWLRALVWAHLGTGAVYLVGLVLHHRVFRSGRRATRRETGGDAPRGWTAGERDVPPPVAGEPGPRRSPTDVRRRRRPQGSQESTSAVSSPSQTTKRT